MKVGNSLVFRQLAAHQRAARAAFPGPDYYAWLRWLHEQLRPRAYCEIGVEHGHSLALVRPETHAIGIDPAPRIGRPASANTKLFPVRSDDFFSAGHADKTLGEIGLDFGFIDGLHAFEQAVRDFIHLERYARPGAVIALHDVLPICAAVATPQQRTLFWTGDCFKTLLVLTDVRPDLRLAMIPCYPSGLSIITGLDPQNATNASVYDAAIATWRPAGFDVALADLKRRVVLVSNDFAAVAQYLAIH